MYDSILITIKKMLGLQAGYTPFDSEILVFINSALMVLQQLGVGPTNGFTVYSDEEIWSDFIPTNTMMESVKTYVYLSVKIIFDPPGSSFVLDAMKSLKDELEWRLKEQAEFYPGDGTTKGYWEQAAVESADGE